MSLSVSNVVRVSVNLSPLAAAVRSFGVLMIAGDSNVIDGVERFRTYLTIEGVAADFGTSAPEYLAAAKYFGQTPKPMTLMIGRWFRTASSGFNEGGILTTAQQLLSAWTGITTGAFKVALDGAGSPTAVSGCDFSSQTTLNGVASVITARLVAAGLAATCTWNGSSFIITSTATGTSSAVSYLTSPASGADISAQLKMTSSTALILVAGYAAESPVACAAVLANMSTAWYGLMFQAATQPTNNQSLAVSDFIEALDVTRIYGVTVIDTAALSSASTTDLPYLMAAAGYLRSFCQYSENAYAIASFFGRGFSVNFTQPNATITLMFKQEPGVTGEDLTQNEAQVLKDKRCNVFVDYVNDTTIIQYGVMSGEAFFDEIHGLDWLQNAVQTADYNVLYTSTSKVPQTDAGVNQLVNAIGQVMNQGVINGLIAPGVWNAPGFGQLLEGQYLKTGYYIYAQPVALQSQADRETRAAPPIQVAVKLAGAIQSVNVVIDVNR